MTDTKHYGYSGRDRTYESSRTRHKNAAYLGLTYREYESDALGEDGQPIVFASITHQSITSASGLPMPLFQGVADQADQFLRGYMWAREILVKGVQS